MIHETLDEIEKLLTQSELSIGQKLQLEALYQELRDELSLYAETDPEHAKTIADYAKMATIEAVNEHQSVDLDNLHNTLGTFEGSHPRLASLLQTLITHLAGIGI